jgi:uncharacterized protein with GYD domain
MMLDPTNPNTTPTRHTLGKYLFKGSYIGDGLKGLLKEGGSKRIEAARQLFEGLGGKLESFHFAFGDDDLIVIFEVPDNASAAAMSLVINSTGAARGNVMVLLTPEEIDQAAQKTVSYRAPGQS